ncbi:MAG TPA: Rossmann-like and DUF2520 domain-containing protein [Pyrinomonadaceae bacterium]|jgi:predicted short-subunit dehydrogenase-like oxidoreductase (DUF2520 family)|nr:Rossmann-like and DUF2520 domain-containing protein [Pyrinomonadaceae bacterium]
MRVKKAPAVAHKSSSAKAKRVKTNRPLTINIIGAGRLGTALALALSARGHSIEAIVARRLNHARKAAQLIGDRHTLSLALSKLDQLPPADIIFITTPDDVIAGVAAQLATSLKQDGRRKPTTVLHASGALSSLVLSVLRERGFRTGSMHPLVSVSEPRAGALSLHKAFYGVEGERAAVAAARSIVRDLGGQSFSLDTRNKALYHAAAVMASGHMVALLDIAAGMLVRCGLSERRARAVLMPLVRSTVDNLSQSEPRRALTGTFARADAATVLRHLDTLNAPGLRDALAAYILLGQHSLQLAQANGADAAALKEIARALDSVKL